jgi:hypothetical protein
MNEKIRIFFIIWSHRGGFQFMLILDLWGISFHPVVVVGLGKSRVEARVNTVKSRVEARVTIQEIKSLGVLQTETCH